MTSPQTLPAVRLPARGIESVLASRWARVLIPSLSDLFLLAILVWLFVGGGVGLLADATWDGTSGPANTSWTITRFRTTTSILSPSPALPGMRGNGSPTSSMPGCTDGRVSRPW